MSDLEIACLQLKEAIKKSVSDNQDTEKKWKEFALYSYKTKKLKQIRNSHNNNKM